MLEFSLLEEGSVAVSDSSESDVSLLITREFSPKLPPDGAMEAVVKNHIQSLKINFVNGKITYRLTSLRSCNDFANWSHHDFAIIFSSSIYYLSLEKSMMARQQLSTSSK